MTRPLRSLSGRISAERFGRIADWRLAGHFVRVRHIADHSSPIRSPRFPFTDQLLQPAVVEGANVLDLKPFNVDGTLSGQRSYPMIPFSAVPARSLLLIALSAFAMNDGTAAEYRCETPNVGVFGDDRRSASLACDGAKRAVTFLRAHGLRVSSEVGVELVDQLANEAAAGHLVSSSKKAVVLNYANFLEFGEWLRVPIDAEIYRALVAHEVAHVVAAHNFQISKPTIQAHEYIAYVTMFATLNATRRELVLSKFSGDGFETEQQMNTTIYLCDPMRFGAEAYRHYVKKGKDVDFLHSILSGDVLTN